MSKMTEKLDKLIETAVKDGSSVETIPSGLSNSQPKPDSVKVPVEPPKGKEQKGKEMEIQMK